jgi:hypothetical protein
MPLNQRSFIDVEMGDLAGLVAVVAGRGSCGPMLERRLKPRRLRMRETDALEMPSSPATALQAQR